MAKLKAEHKALSHGGMKFLYARENIVAIARFWGNVVYVGIVSTNGQDVDIRLPLGAVGAKGIVKDVFGKETAWKKLDDNTVALTVKAHQAYFLECESK